MKKSIICILAAILMLSLCVSAGQTAPDANGNVVCSGQYTTRYNPQKLNAIMIAISEPDLVNGGTTDLVACEDSGRVRMDYRPGFAEGHFVEFARIYGTVTATTSTKKIEIADGALIPLEFPEDRRVLSPLSIKGNTIILQLVKDAQEKINPMFRIAGNPSYEMESIFFGCQKKDAEGREFSCSMSGQLYNEGNSEKGQLTIAGYGFVSAKNAFEAYDVEHAANIQELEEKTEVELESDFVAIPLTDLKEIKVTISGQRIPKLLNLYAKAQAETSAIGSFKIRSSEEVLVKDFIENYRPQDGPQAYDFVLADIAGKKDLRITINPQWAENNEIIKLDVVPNPDEDMAKAGIYLSGGKIAETGSSIMLWPEARGGYYAEFVEELDSSDFYQAQSLLLEPSKKAITVYSSETYVDAYLLTDYDTVTIVPKMDNNEMTGSVKVTNTRNGAWILYENNELTWTPGKTIAGLGFNFNVNLNPAAGEDEMLRCATDGICWLGSTMVVNPAGLTQEKLDEGIENIRSSPRPRVVEEGAKGIGGCRTDRDCDSTQKCLRGQCIEEETECIITDDCARGEICDRGQCLTSEEALGATIEEKGAFRRAWGWFKGLFS